MSNSLCHVVLLLSLHRAVVIILNLNGSPFRFFLYVFLAAAVVLMLVGAQQLFNTFGVSVTHRNLVRGSRLCIFYL